MDISKLELPNKERNIILDFKNYLRSVLRLSKNSIDSYISDVEQWLLYCNVNQISYLNARTIDLESFYQDKYGSKQSVNSMVRSLASLQNFYLFLEDHNFEVENPLTKLARPKKSSVLPSVLSYGEINRLLEAPNLNSKFGIRDRAILEVMYAAGLRVSEVTSLRLVDLHLSMNLINIIGKGDIERVVPINNESVKYLNLYFQKIRNKLIKDQEVAEVFLNYQGKKISRQSIWKMIKKYLQIAGIEKEVTPHTLRHSFATHLLANGADIRSVQELLGHQNVSTTQIYTHIANNLLLKVYHDTKPRE